MQITHQADYATRAVLDLARTRNGKFVSTNEIARRQNIPFSFLAKIMMQLSIAGVIQTSRGAHGGVKLARDPRNITLLEVVEAIDGPIQLNACVVRKDICAFGENCPIQSVWCDAQNELIMKLGSTDFAQMSRAMGHLSP